jgi:hypothetical protein
MAATQSFWTASGIPQNREPRGFRGRCRMPAADSLRAEILIDCLRHILFLILIDA